MIFSLKSLFLELFLIQQVTSSAGRTFQRSRHGRTFFGFGGGHSTARMASSKTVFRPFCVSAEHSRYLTAPTSLAIDRPCKQFCDSVHLRSGKWRPLKNWILRHAVQSWSNKWKAAENVKLMLNLSVLSWTRVFEQLLFGRLAFG